MRGDTGKGRKTLGKLREEILEAAKDLGRIQEKNGELKSENAALERTNETRRIENSALDLKIENKRRELLGLETTSEERRSIVVMLDESAGESSERLAEVQRQAQALLDQILTFENRGAEAEADAEKKQARREQLESSIYLLVGEKVALEHGIARLFADVARARETKESVTAAIDEALKKFSVFERRINQFSRDTGYIVGFVRPDTLVPKE